MSNKNLNFPLRQENSMGYKPSPITAAFAAKLTPYRSLGRHGFFMLMGFLCFTCLLSGIFFLVAGAWPVMIAMGADILAIWLAFKINYRSARRYEEIFVWRDKMIVRAVSPGGKSIQAIFNPLWVRFHIERHEEFGVMKMKLCEAGRELELGSFLNPDDRDSFASALTAALGDIRK